VLFVLTGQKQWGIKWGKILWWMPDYLCDLSWIRINGLKKHETMDLSNKRSLTGGLNMRGVCLASCKLWWMTAVVDDGCGVMCFSAPRGSFYWLVVSHVVRLSALTTDALLEERDMWLEQCFGFFSS